MEVIAISNLKGGSGKTTTTINLGGCLSQMGKKVLIIDFDMQGNTSNGVNHEDATNTIYECLINDKLKLKDVIVKTDFENLDIITANINLANAEAELLTKTHGEKTLKNKIHEEDLGYDYILIDCNPSVGLLVLNALMASNSVIVPMEAEVFAYDGVINITNFIAKIKKNLNNKLKIKGILITQADKTNLNKEISKEILNMNINVFNTVIHRTVRIGEAQVDGKPINYYKKTCKGSKEYIELAKEIM